MFPLPVFTWVKLGLAAVVIVFAYYMGYSGEHNKFVNFQKSVELAAKVQEEKVAAVTKQHELVNEGVKDEYEAKLAAVHNYYSQRMRNKDTSSRRVPTNAKPAVRIVRVPADAGLVERCAATTAQLTELQAWVQKQLAVHNAK